MKKILIFPLQNNIILKKIFTIIMKILNNRLYFSLALVFLILIISLGCCHPYYQTCDDWVMKSIIEGSLSPDGKSHAFVFWQNLFYTNFLKNLYVIKPNFYWYDTFSYLFLSISVFIITMCLYSIKNKYKTSLNIILFLLSLCIYLPVFIFTQFSIVSGCLAISGIILCFYIYTKKLTVPQTSILSVVSIFLIIQSSFIRYEIPFFLLPLSLLISLLLLKKDCIKKYLTAICIIGIGYCASYSLYLEYANIINNTPEYKKIRDTHIARLELTERTSIFSDKNVYNKPWKALEDKIDIDKRLSHMDWNSGTYRILLTWLDLGDNNIFNVSKMKQVKKELKDELEIKKHFNFSFNVADYWNIAKYYLLMLIFLNILLFSPKGIKKTFCLLISYFVFILAANNIFRLLPPRVFINIFNLIVLSTFFILKENLRINYLFKFIQKSVLKISKIYSLSKDINKRIYCFLILFIFVIFVGYSYTPTKKIIKITSYRNSQYNNFMSIIPKLDPTNIYIIDYEIDEIASCPFKQNILKRGKNLLVITPVFNEIKKFLLANNIPMQDTIKSICESDKFFLLGPGYKSIWMRNTQDAIKKFMKQTYYKDIAFKPNRKYVNKNIIIYDILVLTPEQVKRIKQLKEDLFILGEENEDFY